MSSDNNVVNAYKSAYNASDKKNNIANGVFIIATKSAASVMKLCRVWKKSSTR